MENRTINTKINTYEERPKINKLKTVWLKEMRTFLNS